MEKKRNLWVIPTNKPSRLALQLDWKPNYNLQLSKIADDWTLNWQKQNIYITSDDEDTNELDYIITKDGKLVQVSYLLSIDLEQASKVVLTTDKELIEDGVQEIDDEFLEWFVKNPSCEEVEVEEFEPIYGHQNNSSSILYKIIIPKQETLEQIDQNNPVTRGSTALVYKQETLEEAAKKFADDCTLVSDAAAYKGFIDGAKCQQERSYSDDEVKKIAFDFYYDMSHKMNVPENLISENMTNVDVWFETFKNKK